MAIEEFLNQYELDWAQAPFREKKLDFKRISNKKIVISGGLCRSMALTFLSSNDKNGLGNKIVIADDGSINLSDFSIIKDRADFEIVNIESLPMKPDFWIETGFYGVGFCSSPEHFSNTLKNANQIVTSIMRICPEKLIFLSDTAVYGDLKPGFAASEYEQGVFDFGSENLGVLLSQSIENLFVSASHQAGIDYNILRCSDIICSFSPLKSIDSIIQKLAGEEKLLIKLSQAKVSYVYINDVLTAVFYVMAYGRQHTVYNVCGDESDVSSEELVTILKDLFPGHSIAVDDKGIKLSGCAVKNTKLKALGWTPSIGIRDAWLISKHAYVNSDEVFMFPDAYDGKLEVIQQILLGYLMEIDRICKKHNIKYFLGGGSLLGAVRHHGFIPWDDDADVMMLREDYDKFLSVLPNELPSNLFYQSPSTETLNHCPFTKIRINNTIFSTKFTSKFMDMHNGIFLDVLAQDQTSNNKLIRKLHVYATICTRSLVFNKWKGSPVKAKRKFDSAAATFLKNILPMKFLEWIQDKVLVLFKNKKNAKYLYDSMGRNVGRGAFPKEWLDEVIWVDFENVKMPIPKEYDKYLKYLYGDYMNMIPVSKRHVSHDIIQMDLGEYTNYKYTK